MTYPKDPIQSLIAEIDGILNKPSARRPWPVSSEYAQQRQVLERVRDYLVFGQQQEKDSFPFSERESYGQETAQQIAQAVAREMKSLGANLMQPLQAELETLRTERESLLREIRQIENRTSHYHSLAQQQAKQQQTISDFLQVLMDRLQESLTQQVAKTMARLETQFLSFESTDDQSPEASLETPNLESIHFPMHPRERLEQLRQMQAHSDQILINLDSTLRVVLEALQRNVMGYQESLSQGVAKMHNLGQQSEVLLKAFMNQVMQELGREVRPQQEDSSDSGNDFTAQYLARAQQLPYPGMEWPSQQQPRPQEQGIKESIEQKLISTEETVTPVPLTSNPPSPQYNSLTTKNPSRSQPDSSLNPENWEVIKLDLNNLGVEPIDPDEIDTLLQLDIDSWVSESTLIEEKSRTGNEKVESLSPTSTLGELSKADNRDQQIPPSVSSDITQELDDLYALLFDSEPWTDTVAQDDFPSLTPAGAIAPQAQGNPEESRTDLSPLSKKSEVEAVARSEDFESPSLPVTLNPSSAQDDSLLPAREDEHIEDSLFAGLESEMATFTQSPSLGEPILFPSGEDALFYEDLTRGSTETTQEYLAPHSLYGNPEEVETIALLTDLLDEQQLKSPEEITSANSVEEVRGTNKEILEETAFTPLPLDPVISAESLPYTSSPESQYGQQSDESFSRDLVEDIYICASPEENLLVTPQSEEQLDEINKLLLQEETLQLLSEDLSSFESFKNQNVPVQKQPLGRADGSQAIPEQNTQKAHFKSEIENQQAPADPSIGENFLGTKSETGHDQDSLAPTATPQSNSDEATQLTDKLAPNASLELMGRPSTQTDAENLQFNDLVGTQTESNPQQSQPQMTAYELLAEDWENFADGFDLESSSSKEASLKVTIDSSVLESDQPNLILEMDLGLVDPVQKPESIASVDQINHLQFDPESEAEPVQISPTIDSQSQPVEWEPDIFEWEELKWEIETAITGEEIFSNWTSEEVSTDFEMEMLNFGLRDPAHEAETVKSSEQINHSQFPTQSDAEESPNHALLGEETISPQHRVSQSGVEAWEVGERSNLPLTASSSSPEIASPSRQEPWDLDLPFQDFNWELETGLGEGEETFNNWLLQADETDLVMPDDSKLAAPSQEARTIEQNPGVQSLPNNPQS